MVKKILIFGWLGGGTTILRTMLGKLDDVYEVEGHTVAITDEMTEEAESKGCKAVVASFPYLINFAHGIESQMAVFTDYIVKPEIYGDHELLFLVRDPSYIFGALNDYFYRRGSIPYRHGGEWFQKVGITWIMTSRQSIGNLRNFRYEDIFDDTKKDFRNLIEEYGLTYDEKMVDPEQYRGYQIDFSMESIVPDGHKHHNLEHRVFRALSDHIKNMNDPDTLNLTDHQKYDIQLSHVVAGLGYRPVQLFNHPVPEALENIEGVPEEPSEAIENPEEPCEYSSTSCE